MKYHKKWPKFLQGLIYVIIYPLFRIFCHFEVEGRENVLKISSNQPLILAANHTSEWDVIMVRMALPFFWKRSPMYYVSRSKEGYNHTGLRGLVYGGLLFTLLGGYPTYSGKKDYSYSLKNHIELVKSGKALCIFPEGRVSRDGLMGEAHGGMVFIAQTCKALIIPVAISGLISFNLKDFILARRKIIVTFGEPIDISRTISPLLLSAPAMGQSIVSPYKVVSGMILKKIRNMLKYEP